MQLRAIQEALDAAGLLVEGVQSDATIAGVTDDSRKVVSGSLFCAIDGTAVDGHSFLNQVVGAGAAAALVTSKIELQLPQIVVRDGRRAAGVAAREWFSDPSGQLALIGVTGTNGKTTTVSILWHLLNDGLRAGRIGTLGVFDGSDAKLDGYASLTTLGPVEFHSALADLQRRGTRTVVMEASSHGLDQGRLDAAQFGAAVYTNLTHEHLDYHVDLDAYAAAKMRLSGLLADGGVEIVNADTDVWNTLPDRPGIRRLRFGREPSADVRAVSEQLNPTGSVNVFRFGSDEHEVRLPLLGEFNVSNALAAAATAYALGIHPEQIARRLADVPLVPGRMELLTSGSYTVLRDYAHTPDGFKRAIDTIKAVTKGRLVVLFGVGGDRDRKKRPVMGRIAAEGADLVVLTEDNPRTEDPETTIDDIEKGMENTVHLRIRDREEGIRTAISLLEAGDCLLLLGKGHETYQLIGSQKLPFDERTIVKDAMEEMA